ncbi:hypothetical protein FBEOM_4597 [Fusarium beomiforme]|uniref:Uncharacterized protein n=1 Tax=Fusarium beomiforme TaxID=44412 RepID=A0A9P5AMG7_9HYPO|nr:hypothetical protein FBEOM_4597 [Fusarium beomiforme]
MSQSEELESWVQPSRDATLEVGHYQYSPDIAHTKNVWCTLFKRTLQEGFDSLVVVPCHRSEVDTVHDAWIETMGHTVDSALLLYHYSDMTSFIECQKTEKGFNGNKLDRDIFLFSMYPDLPADCALSLVATMCWAMDISQHSCTRFLTVSWSEPEDAFLRLTQYFGLSKPKVFCHPDGNSDADVPEEKEQAGCDLS